MKIPRAGEESIPRLNERAHDCPAGSERTSRRQAMTDVSDEEADEWVAEDEDADHTAMAAIASVGAPRRERHVSERIEATFGRLPR